MLDHSSRPERGRDATDYARFVLDAFGAADYELNLQTGALHASDRFYALYGYPADHPLTLAEFAAHHHPSDSGALDAIVAHAAEQGQTQFQREFRILRSDGTTCWVLSRGQVVLDDAGRPQLLRGAVLDITERKQAEARLAISAANDAFRVRLSDTLRPLADPVAIQGQATRVLGEHLQANRVAYFEISGPDYVVEHDYVQGNQSLRGRYPTEAFGPHILAAYRAGRVLVCHDVQTDPLLSPSQRAAHAAIQIGAFIGVPLVKDGQFVAGLTVHHVTPRVWTGDEIALVAEVAERTLSAVTQARAEAALRASEAQYRALTELSAQMVWMLEPDGRIAYLSQEWFAYTGAPREQLHEQGWLQVLHPDDQARISAEFEQVLARGEPYEMELRLRAADGGYRWHLSRARPIIEDGRLARWFGVTVDIHERKRAEAALAARAAQDAYRLRLADALRAGSDVQEIEGAATRVLGEQLGAARVAYFSAQGDGYVVARDFAAGVASLQGRFPAERFGPSLFTALRAGCTVVTPEMSTDALLGPVEREVYQSLAIAAQVAVPLVKDCRLAAGLLVQMSVARTWTTEEVALIEETVEQIWAAIELARVERARRESEMRLQLVLDGSAMGSFVWNVAEDRGEPDERLLAHFGLPPDGTITLAQALAELLHPDDRDRYAEAVRRAVDSAGDGKLRVEIRAMQPDGSARWLAITGQTFFTGSPPHPTRMAGVSADITERKQAEARLAAAAARDQYRLYLADALRSLSDTGAVQAAATRVLGEQLGASRVTYFEVEGDDYVVHRDFARDVPSIVGRFPIVSFGPHLLAALRAGRTLVEPDVAADVRLSPAEHAAYAALNIAAYVGATLVKDGRLVGGLTVHMAAPRAWTTEEVRLVEETAERTWAAVERASAEARLHELYAQEQAARRAAEEAVRLKDEFLATVSHELRTPLTALLGYAELLQRGKRDESYVARAVAKIRQSAQAQAQLVEDLLDISRIVSGKLKLAPEPLHLADVVIAAVDTVRPMLDAKRIHLDLDLSPEVASIMGDPHRLQQVLWNLLSNAGKFTPAGGTVAVRLQQTDQHVSVAVSDTGQGIAPEFLPYVFDRFRQADGTSQRSHGGLGLGLAIVRHLVELHGGAVTAWSAGPGQGATFTVQLPRAGQPVTWLHDSEVEREGAERELAGLRILVVDDQSTVLEVVAELLAAYGATVEACTSAVEALATLRAAPPAVLISDIAMPGRDGYWLIEQVRRLPPEAGGTLPAIALTAYVQLEDRLRVLAAGYQQYVPKPVDSAELRDVILALTAPDETSRAV